MTSTQGQKWAPPARPRPLTNGRAEAGGRTAAPRTQCPSRGLAHTPSPSNSRRGSFSSSVSSSRAALRILARVNLTLHTSRLLRSPYSPAKRGVWLLGERARPPGQVQTQGWTTPPGPKPCPPPGGRRDAHARTPAAMSTCAASPTRRPSPTWPGNRNPGHTTHRSASTLDRGGISRRASEGSRRFCGKPSSGPPACWPRMSACACAGRKPEPMRAAHGACAVPQRRRRLARTPATPPKPARPAPPLRSPVQPPPTALTYSFHVGRSLRPCNPHPDQRAGQHTHPHRSLRELRKRNFRGPASLL